MRAISESAWSLGLRLGLKLAGGFGVALMVMGCQVPMVMQSDDFKSHDSLFFLHMENQKKGMPEVGKRVYFDGVELKNFDKLNKKGVVIPEGKHDIDITDDPKKKRGQHLEYIAEKGKEYHLVYCHEDESLHWYAFSKEDSNKENFTRRSQEICSSLSNKKK